MPSIPEFDIFGLQMKFNGYPPRSKQLTQKTRMDVTVKRSIVYLLTLLLLPAALTASTHSLDENNSIMIKVLRSETVPLQAGSTVIEGCNQADYSASCRHSSSEFVQNQMVVQSQDGTTFTIACTIESKWSNCIPLPIGESFRARVEKDGLSVVYLGSKGKPVVQEYRVVPFDRSAASPTKK